MAAEHGEHEPMIDRLVSICAALEEDPRRLAELAVPLAPLAAALETELLGHLEREERIVFPALRALPDVERAALTRAIRARREAAPALR
jgi:iron-sulfur cluster repair protein YtfE (RIC family)